MHFTFRVLACALLAVWAGPVFAGQSLEIAISGQRDWNWKALTNTTHGAYAPYAALGRAFAANMKLSYSGPSWEKDEIHVPLSPESGGKFSGQGKWDAVVLWPASTAGMNNFDATVQYKTPMAINNLKPFIRGNLDPATGQMNVDIDILLSGPATGGDYTTSGHLGDATANIKGSLGSGAYSSHVNIPGAATGTDRVGGSGGTSTFQAKGDLAREMAKSGVSPTQTQHVAAAPKVDKPAYIHLRFSVPWKNGAMIPVKGQDEYGTYTYTVRVRPASFVPPPPAALPRDDAGLCVAGVMADNAHLDRQHVAGECGCYIPKIRASTTPADYATWRRIVELTSDTRTPDGQKASDMMSAMSHAPAGWDQRFEAADSAAQRTCHIADWN